MPAYVEPAPAYVPEPPMPVPAAVMAAAPVGCVVQTRAPRDERLPALLLEDGRDEGPWTVGLLAEDWSPAPGDG